MSGLKIEVDVVGFDHFAEELQRYRNAIADRRPLHAAMAVPAAELTRYYLRGLDRHKSAENLGATPTGFRAKSAQGVESASDEEGAYVRIPRSTGLGRAFHGVTILPGSGRTYLTIPGCAETYGKQVRDFPADTFAFTIMAGRYPVLVWRKSGGAHRGWTLAYWLKRSVTQKQDRTLLPSDAAYTEVGRRAALAYITSHIYHAP